MENCVECILVHGDGSPEELIRKLSTLPAGSTAAGNTAAAVNDIDADEELARQLAAESNNYARTTTNNAAAAAARRQQLQEQRRPMASTVSAPSSSSLPSRNSRQQTKGRGTPTILPSDFLRIPGRNYSSDNIIATSSSAAVSNNNEQLPVNSNGMTDEQLARMLQDELFQEELRNNPEFSHLAHGGGRGGQQPRARQQQQQQQGPDFFDKLSELGDVAKNRFQAFAAGWNTQNSSGGGGGGLFGVGGGNNTNATSSPRGNERRGLLSDLDMDEDEEEMDFVGGSGGGGRDVELQSVGRSGDKKTD